MVISFNLRGHIWQQMMALDTQTKIQDGRHEMHYLLNGGIVG